MLPIHFISSTYTFTHLHSHSHAHSAKNRIRKENARRLKMWWQKSSFSPCRIHSVSISDSVCVALSCARAQWKMKWKTCESTNGSTRLWFYAIKSSPILGVRCGVRVEWNILDQRAHGKWCKLRKSFDLHNHLIRRAHAGILNRIVKHGEWKIAKKTRTQEQNRKIYWDCNYSKNILL